METEVRHVSDNHPFVNARVKMSALVDLVRSVGADARGLQIPRITLLDAINVGRCIGDDPVGYSAIKQFEEKLQELTGSKHAVAVSSGTAALHLALVAAGVKSGDEVIVPTLAFVAVANAVSYIGAIPHFVDSDSKTLGIAPFRLRGHLSNISIKQGDVVTMNKITGRRIAAIVPVHLLGLPCDIEEIKAIALPYHIAVIEDAAEALGSTTGGRACGTFGVAGILSFNNNKIVSTGGGGAVITNDEGLAAHVRNLATTAKKPHPWRYDHTEIGWNYRMPNICAAMGMGQLERLPETLKAKRALASRYHEAFSNSGIAVPITEVEGRRSNYWLNAVRLDPMLERDIALGTLAEMGFPVRAVFTPLHTLPMFRHCPRQERLFVAEEVFDTVICLPSTP